MAAGLMIPFWMVVDDIATGNQCARHFEYGGQH